VSIPASVITTPDFSASASANGDLIRRVIEARTSYERLCGFAPTCIHVNGLILKALLGKGFKVGAEIAGMRIIASPESIADMALCSRDENLFKVPDPKLARAKGKAR
jgi:hypothetical protein